MTPDTLVFAVRSLVRLGAAARAAYEQQVRDRGVRLADLEFPTLEGDAALRQFFFSNDELEKRSTSGDLKVLWTADLDPVNDDARRKLIEVQADFIAAQPPAENASQTEATFAREPHAVVLLEQWSKDAKPPSPLMRIALALADIAIDYVTTNPGVLGVGSAGEKLIGSIGGSLRDLLPDADDKAKWQGQEGTLAFGERALAIAFQAGLTAVQKRPDVLTPKKEYQALITNTLKPLVDVFKATPEQRPTFSEMRDTILGPVTEAAIATVQQNQTTILGSRFDAGTLLGTVTGVVLGEAGKSGLTQLLTNEGLLRLHRAVLGVAAAQPQLFIKGADPGAAATRKLVASLANVLKTAQPPLTQDLIAEIAVTALDVFGREAPSLLHLGEGWNDAAAASINDLVGGLAAGLENGNAAAAFQTSFSASQLVKISEILFAQIARTPGMLAKDASPEVKALTAALTTLLTTRGAELLAPSDWTTLTTSIAAEVARNPARLVAAADKPEGQLLVKLVSAVFAVAGDAQASGRSSGNLLFGETLRDCLRLTLQAAAGNATKAEGHLDDFRRFLVLLNRAAAEQPGRLGAREWLALFERHVAHVLDEGLGADLTGARLMTELKR